MAQLFGSFGEAFAYAGKNTFSRPLQWLGMSVVLFLAAFAFYVGIIFLGEAFIENQVIDFFSNFGFGFIGSILQSVLDPALYTVLGIIALVIGFVLSLFFCGIEVQILGGNDVTFKGFFGSIGRGFQLCVISLIYEIVFLIVAVLITIGFGGLMTISDLGGILGLGAGLLILLAAIFVFFAIFMIPATVNFATQRKFGAAFHFKEIGALIGRAKWYKILFAIIIYAVVAVILFAVLSFICGLLDMIPVVGFVISLIVLCFFSMFLFYFCTSYWAKFFLEA